MEKRKYKKRNLWNAQTEQLLVELWSERIGELRGARRNGHIFNEMAVELRRQGCVMSKEEIKSKIQNLSSRYRKEKAMTGPSGGSPSEWPLYFKIHEIIGRFKINNVDYLVEESIEEYMEFDSSSSLPTLAPPSPSPPSPSSPPLASTSTPMASPSEAEWVDSPELDAGKKQKKNAFQQELLKKFDKIEEEIKKENEDFKKVEERKTNLMEKYVSDAAEMKDAFIAFLQNIKK